MSIEQALDLREAVERTAKFFADRETRAGVQARALLQRPRPEDTSLAEHLVRERRRATRMDGSIEGSLVRTAWTTWELLELGCPRDHAAVVRTLGFVLSTQNGPGHFAEGCSEHRHALKICRHYVTGFFSPATRDESVAPLEFPSGVVVTHEEEARFAASCFALRIVLLADGDRREAVRRHLDSLLVLAEAKEPATNWSADLTYFALGALAAASFEYRQRLQQFTDRALESHNPARDWSTVDVFHALDALLAIPTAAARVAVQQTAPALCSLQRDSGAFDAAESEQRALIGLRALCLAQQAAMR